MVAKHPVSAGDGPARPRRIAFARGFRQRNPLVLVAAALLAGLLILLAQQAFLRGGFTAVSEGRFLRIENDDYIHLAYRLAQLKKDPPVGPTLYLFGGSGAMESIVSQRALAQQLERDGAGKVNVISLAAHRETLAATLALIDNLPPGQVALAVGLTPMRFTASPAEDAGLLPAGLLRRLAANPSLRVRSVFSHLAASEDPAEDEFTLKQISRFTEMSSRITSALSYPVLLHILNSAGITRFPQAHFDMVRLGIGLYGVGSSAAEQALLRNVSTLKSVVTQVKCIPAGDTIGYNRKGKAEQDTLIAIIPVGYADGLNRRLGNGRGNLYIHGIPAPRCLLAFA